LNQIEEEHSKIIAENNPTEDNDYQEDFLNKKNKQNIGAIEFKQTRPMTAVLR